jgi:hypothetical protein
MQRRVEELEARSVGSAGDIAVGIGSALVNWSRYQVILSEP